MPARTGCCSVRVCGFSYFVDAGINDLAKLSASPADTAPNWHYTLIWGTPTAYENNAGIEATPASSLQRVLSERNREGQQDFVIAFQVLPLFDPAIPGSVAQQVGAFIADAFVVWADFTDNTIRWGLCDSTGLITAAPGSGNLVKSLGFYPLEAFVQVHVFQNEKGTWNLQFIDPERNVFYLTVFDVTLPGLAPGPISAGFVTGHGGGGIRNFALTCPPPGGCGECWDGLVNSYQKTTFAPAGNIVTDPATLPVYALGTCAWIASGLLDPSITTVSTVAGALTLYTSVIEWWLSTAGELWFGGNYAGSPAETVTLTAYVTYLAPGGFGGPGGRVAVACYICTWEDFCCYGGPNHFVKTRLFPNGGFGGVPFSDYYQEQYTGWPDSLDVTANDVSGMPCTKTCGYRAVKNIITGLLEWSLVSPDAVSCVGGHCPTVPFDPMYLDQRAYVTC